MGAPAVAGVDGCRAGWVAAVLSGGGLDWALVEAAEVPRLGARVGVDMPVGLPSGGVRRAADAAARARLPAGRRSSVFPVPDRSVLAATTYPEACAVSRAAGGRALSLQSWYLVPKTRELEGVLLAAGPGVHDRVAEVHPEVSFCAMAASLGAATDLPGKKTADGRAARRALLSAWLGAEVVVPRLPGAGEDDLLDAAACAWTAQRWLRGEHEVLGDPSAVDDVGLPMRILV